MKNNNKAVLMILDGMGINCDASVSATTRSAMPYTYQLMDMQGYALLEASGVPVGLDATEVGNSEVGHLSIGAGRVLSSTLTRIRDSYADGSWESSAVWSQVDAARSLHIVGLLSDAGVHGHWQTMVMAADTALKRGINDIQLHVLLDGVDSQAGSAPALLKLLQEALALYGGKVTLASVMGRKWASDRSGKWELTRYCVDQLKNWQNSLEFNDLLLASHLETSGRESDFNHAFFPGGRPIASGETILLTSHRADRISQLAKLFNEEHRVLAMVELQAEAVPVSNVFFPTRPLEGGLITELKKFGYRTVRLSEQCKFPHVTYFLDGLATDSDAKTIEIPTIADELIRERPEMSIKQLGSELESLMSTEGESTVIFVNVPNLDQVGHQGDFSAALKAAAHVDELVQKVVKWSEQYNWRLMFTADHGNADCMIDKNGKPLGSHSPNPVPLIAKVPGGDVIWLGSRGSLANVAGSFLTLLGHTVPDYMHGSLLEPAYENSAERCLS